VNRLEIDGWANNGMTYQDFIVEKFVIFEAHYLLEVKAGLAWLVNLR
jgi:hypothetical protein